MTEYWDHHYSHGGVSGDGDTKDSERWKKIILLQSGFSPDKSIIDVGCGDMVFWEGLHLTDYTGIDISEYRIEENKKEYPDYKFYCVNSSRFIGDLPKAEIVICFDVLFHIMNEDEYIQTLLNLMDYSKDKLFIYTWAKNPFDSFINRLIVRKPFSKIVTDGKYQYYRNFKKYSQTYIEGQFNLVSVFTNTKWKYGAMYYYKRR